MGTYLQIKGQTLRLIRILLKWLCGFSFYLTHVLKYLRNYKIDLMVEKKKKILRVKKKRKIHGFKNFLFLFLKKINKLIFINKKVSK